MPELHGAEIELMNTCSKCGAAVKEEKAFCQNCGNPMDAAMAQRDAPMPDFSATILVPPKRPTQGAPPPPPAEVKPAQTTPVAPQQPTAPVAQPTTPVVAATAPSPPVAARRTARKIGVGFILLLLFLTFAAFVIALWLD